jgi:DNA-binding MarR family transcriptional regulator/GNAT superfamily N-acetyltransferase
MGETGLDTQIAEMRAFNRFYTGLIGVLNESVYESPFTLAEARVLFELGHKSAGRAADLAAWLGMDKAQMSRILRRLRDRDLLASDVSASDGRARALRLTPRGQAAIAMLDGKSAEQVGGLLARHGQTDRQSIVDAMHLISSRFADGDNETPVVLRPHRIGELGWLINRQALLYHHEQGWNAEFEALIARIYADYEEAPDSPPKSLWIAECRNAIAGSIFIVPAADRPGAAQLRMLYVEPFARGRGVGHRLVSEAVRFSRETGYEHIILWTQDCLTAARKVYQRAGFRLVKEERHHSFGADLNGQYWELELQ